MSFKPFFSRRRSPLLYDFPIDSTQSVLGTAHATLAAYPKNRFLALTGVQRNPPPDFGVSIVTHDMPDKSIEHIAKRPFNFLLYYLFIHISVFFSTIRKFKGGKISVLLRQAHVDLLIAVFQFEAIHHLLHHVSLTGKFL